MWPRESQRIGDNIVVTLLLGRADLGGIRGSITAPRKGRGHGWLDQSTPVGVWPALPNAGSSFFMSSVLLIRPCTWTLMSCRWEQ